MLPYAQALGFDRYSLVMGQQPVEVNADLSVTPEITLQLAGIFTFIFLFAFVSLPGQKGEDRRVD